MEDSESYVVYMGTDGRAECPIMVDYFEDAVAYVGWATRTPCRSLLTPQRNLRTPLLACGYHPLDPPQEH